MIASPPTWPAAAAALARRVTRRDRVGALLRYVGVLLGAGAGVALAGNALFGGPDPALPLAAGLALGVVVGAARALRVRPVRPSDAAYALDRRAGARGRGLVAAVVPGAVGAEAAWAEPRVVPPTVRLRPPEGLSLAAGAALLATLAWLIPGAAAETGSPPAGRARSGDAAAARGAASENDAEQADSEAAEARVAEQVREALGLTRESAADPRLVAERLGDPETRRAAEEASAGTSFAEVVGDDPRDAEDLARALLRGAASEESARSLRRGAAASRAQAAGAAIPPGRRALVERWLAEVGTSGEEEGSR